MPVKQLICPSGDTQSASVEDVIEDFAVLKGRSKIRFEASAKGINNYKEIPATGDKWRGTNYKSKSVRTVRKISRRLRLVKRVIVDDARRGQNCPNTKLRFWFCGMNA